VWNISEPSVRAGHSSRRQRGAISATQAILAQAGLGLYQSIERAHYKLSDTCSVVDSNTSTRLIRRIDAPRKFPRHYIPVLRERPGGCFLHVKRRRTELLCSPILILVLEMLPVFGISP
jgi:hypothetical protein